ncbi:2Fe-2S iron-sulfur cluster binding domain-containing protein [Actinomadura sp. KC345]|nr:2Fe-2S iron-sulfur cluster binding domain-containing protein [Actinomadura sp. KC345]
MMQAGAELVQGREAAAGIMYINSPRPASRATAPANNRAWSTVVNCRRETGPQPAGEPLLQSARRASSSSPFPCEPEHCDTCMARVTADEVKMRVNDALGRIRSTTGGS